MGDKIKTKSNQEKLKILIAFLSGVIVPIIVVYLGSYFEKPIKEKEINTKYIELAVEILNQKPDNQKTNLRKWAIEVVNKYSEVPLTEGAIMELKSEALTVTAIGSANVTDNLIK